MRSVYSQQLSTAIILPNAGAVSSCGRRGPQRLASSLGTTRKLRRCNFRHSHECTNLNGILMFAELKGPTVCRRVTGACILSPHWHSGPELDTGSDVAGNSNGDRVREVSCAPGSAILPHSGGEQGVAASIEVLCRRRQNLNSVSRGGLARTLHLLRFLEP